MIWELTSWGRADTLPVLKNSVAKIETNIDLSSFIVKTKSGKKATNMFKKETEIPTG